MVESNTCRAKFYECQNELNRCFEKLNEEQKVFATECEQSIETFYQKIHKFAKTGEFEGSKAIKELNRESDQENVPVKKTRGRKKKTVLSEITEDNLQGVKVKKEKISTGNQSESTRSSVASKISSIPECLVEEIKTERGDMAAPNWIPPKKKNKEIKSERDSVRTTRTKGKKPGIRDSDVIVQNSTITTISLSDTEESEGEKAQQKEDKKTRSTRTKTKKYQASSESESGTETDTDSTRSTRTKTKKKQEEVCSENSEAESTRSTRTKTIRKGKKTEDEPEEPPQETRSTRTKTIKKVPKANEEPINANIDNKEETITEPPKASRTTANRVPEKNTEAATRTSNSQKTKGVPKPNASKAVPKLSNQSKTKRDRSDSAEEEANDKKRSKSTSPVNQIESNATTLTVYEDARSTIDAPKEKTRPPLNSTYVADVPAVPGASKIAPVPPLNATVTIEPAASSAANCTVVIDKLDFKLFDNKSVEAIFTDDDSIEVKKTPPKKAMPAKASKEVFSPYEKTTLKKKVEAFEKLQNGSEIPVKTSANLRNTRDASTAVKEKAKMFTPTGSRFMPTSSSTSKISRLISQQHNSTSSESLATMKSVQKESRERQKKQMEREQALKKKEAMLLAQTEAKRKLNEEKQLKALQQRKALEVEKLKQLEAQKQKEAKLKQREQEREEYLMKQRLEVEKKRVAQKKKIAEMQAQRQQNFEEQAKHPPIYMTTKLPRLPTEDCYDSDDPDYKKYNPPRWCADDYTKRRQLTMLAAGEKIKNTLFCRHAQTPDLLEIFEVIDPKKLKRSSSVLWRKPPRYTMMPDLNDTRFEEDDELYESD